MPLERSHLQVTGTQEKPYRLEASNQPARYGKLSVLEDISFSVKEGSIIGILGRNDVERPPYQKDAVTQHQHLGV